MGGQQVDPNLIQLPGQLPGQLSGGGLPRPYSRDQGSIASSGVASIGSSGVLKPQIQPEPRITIAFDGKDQKRTDSKQQPPPAHEEAKKNTPTRERAVVRYARIIVENNIFVFVTTMLTFYALTGDDFRVICTEKNADNYFNGMVLICVFIFASEICLSCVGKDDYFLGFFFWLDIISTITLILDLTWVSNLLNGSSGKNVRSGRTARVGARAGRVVRVLRLVRILKLYKAYYESKQRQAELEKRRQAGEEDDWDESDYETADKQEENDKESRVGKKLSEITIRRVICLVLAMLLFLPMLRAEESGQVAYSSDYGADVVWKAFNDYASGNNTKQNYQNALLNYVYYHNWYGYANQDAYCPRKNCNTNYGQLFWIGFNGSNATAVQTITEMAPLATLNSSFVNDFAATAEKNQNFVDYDLAYATMPRSIVDALSQPWVTNCDTDGNIKRGISLIATTVESANSFPVDCPEDLRSEASVASAPQTISKSTVFNGVYMIFYFDLRPFNKTESKFSLGLTFFVMVLLIVASMMFTRDANNLVLRPVQNMVERVEAIRDKPLLAMKMADDEFKAEEIKKAQQDRLNQQKCRKFLMDLVSLRLCSREDKDLMETVVLEKTIIKLGSLLALGFGEAGADIIGNNMRGSDSAGVNAMVPGRRVECIIGICRVRDFSVATEVLQSKVMTFGNQIAEIVHGVCNEFSGAPNKNTGEQFLVIWKDNPENEGLKTRYAEGALVAFSTVVGAIHRSPLLGSYRAHPALQNRLGSHCRVHLSSGLHKGWAIEGAVGSEYKIDCSYLSPNVSIATSVERSTEIYGAALMVAQSVVDLCGQGMRNKCRLIDKVIIKGSPTPIELYCMDLDYMAVEVDSTPRPQVNWNTRQRFKVRQFVETEKCNMLKEDVDMVKVFDNDPVIAMMRKRFTVDFFQMFNMGYQNYSEGEWPVAKRMLSCIIKEHVIDDGPSVALLRFMEEKHSYDAPKNWNGVRELAC